MLVLLRTAKLCHLCLSLLNPPALAMYNVPAASKATHMMIAGQRLYRQSQTRPAQERGQTKVGWHLWLCNTAEMPTGKPLVT
jgi:hypothetical protein